LRIALMADVHANREAFEACLAHAGSRGFDHLLLLGDLVGYGADPVAVLERCFGLLQDGAEALLGNHDEATLRGPSGMSGPARAAIDWTRTILAPAHLDLLGSLPLTRSGPDCLYVHADPVAPGGWAYLRDRDDAERVLGRAGPCLVVCGHVHVPRLWGRNARGGITTLTPTTDIEMPLSRRCRWLAVLGAVGQPRDGLAAASYAMLDTDALTMTWLRVPYDVASAAAKIRAAGLPELLASRLAEGR